MQPQTQAQQQTTDGAEDPRAPDIKLEKDLPAQQISLDTVLDETMRQKQAAVALDSAAFSLQQRKARMFAASGLFLGSQKNMTEDMAIAQAMVKIGLGSSMGFNDAESLQYINVINGVTAISAAARAARMQQAGYNWDIQWHGTDENPTGCTIWLKFKGAPVPEYLRNSDGSFQKGPDGEPLVRQASVSFLKRDAERMLTTIWDNNVKRRASILEKDNWKMTPKNMYFARAITNTQRFYAPGVLNSSLPSVEEAIDFDPERSAPTRETGRTTIDDLKPGTEPNRGHDDTGLHAVGGAITADDIEKATGVKPEVAPGPQPEPEPQPKVAAGRKRFAL